MILNPRFGDEHHQVWRLSEVSQDNLGLACTDQGLVLGRTPLIELRANQFAVRARGEIERLLSKAYKAEIAAERLGIDPYDPGLVQPSSVDVRLDRYFRVFENHRYPHIDPAVEQPDLTRLVETDGEDPFVLHPG